MKEIQRQITKKLTSLNSIKENALQFNNFSTNQEQDFNTYWQLQIQRDPQFLSKLTKEMLCNMFATKRDTFKSFIRNTNSTQLKALLTKMANTYQSMLNKVPRWLEHKKYNIEVQYGQSELYEDDKAVWVWTIKYQIPFNKHNTAFCNSFNGTWISFNTLVKVMFADCNSIKRPLLSEEAFMSQLKDLFKNKALGLKDLSLLNSINELNSIEWIYETFWKDEMLKVHDEVKNQKDKVLTTVDLLRNVDNEILKK